MEKSTNKNNIKNEIQLEEISSINKKTQNKNSTYLDNQPKTFEDEEGNLLDQNDLSYNSEDDQNSVVIFDSEIYFSQKIDQVDVVFLLDTTKSVNPYLKGIKRFIRKFNYEARKSISHYLNDDIDVLKLGIVAYRDHDQDDIENSYTSKILCDLTEDYNTFRKALYEIECKGGDDDCEALVDGLHEAVNLIKWREDSIKLLYHICGSPCHGTIKGEDNKDSKNFDKYEEGCPCGIEIKNVLKTLKGKYIEYNIIALEEDLDKMIEEFLKVIRVERMVANIEKQEGVSGNQDNEDEGDDIIQK